MKRLLFLLFAALAVSSLTAQDLHIYYNAFTDSVYYMQNGNSVDRPAVRKGSNVVLHVDNFNNYLYNVQVKAENTRTTIAQGSALDLSSLLGGGGLNPTELIFGAGSPIGGVPDLSGLGKTSGAVTTQAQIEREARIEEMKDQVAVFKAAQRSIEEGTKRIGMVQQEMQTALEAQQVQSFVADELARLRFNPQLEPRQIKRLSQEYMSRIFGEEDPAQIGLSKVLEKTDVQADFSKKKGTYAQYVTKYSKDIVTLKISSGVLADSKFDFPESNIADFREEAQKVVATAEENLGTYQGNLKTLETQGAGLKSLDAESLLELRTNYLIVMDNAFSKTHREPASNDQMDLQLVFTPIDSTTIKGVSTKYIAPIKVNVYGGLKVNASLGLSFGQFFSRPQSFFVRDSVIRTSDKDAFTPLLTSFVHFYSQGRNSTSLGGSFGIGIPLGGSGSSLEAISFFFGPSLVLGRNQRIVLSGGFMGGKVDQLTKGYAVGDRFELENDLLNTESVYKLGYFLGVSFNLIGK